MKTKILFFLLLGFITSACLQPLFAEKINRTQLKFKSTVPASHYRIKPIKFHVNTCLGVAKDTVKKAYVQKRGQPKFNVFNTWDNTTAVGGTTLTTGVYIVCVKNDYRSSTAVIVTFGPESGELNQRLYNTFSEQIGRRTPID
jgi:hypothetical protein